MTDYIRTQCDKCEHKKLFGCKAFEEIPDEILSSKIIHNKVLKGQTGDFVFTRKKSSSKPSK